MFSGFKLVKREDVVLERVLKIWKVIGIMFYGRLSSMAAELMQI